MRGRKPKPTKLKLLDGNPGRRPLNLQEPEPAPLGVEPPGDLLRHPRALEEWARLVPLLTAARIITAADRNALVAACQQWALYLDATDKVATAGMIVKAPSGYPVQNPYLGIASKALAHCQKLWVELGCTPSARSRVTTTSDGAAVPDKWAGIL